MDTGGKAMTDTKINGDPLARYVTRFSSDWELTTAEPWQEVDGTLVYVDISGFTALSEKLARRGRIGAEELTEVLNIVFTNMLTLAYARRGSLLKFGGDALLLLFTGADHPVQACSAAVEMQVALRDASNHRTSAGRLRLKMSVGIHSGTVHLFRAGSSHHELILTGPAATETTTMEETAVAGEVLISSATRVHLPAGSADEAKGDGWLLRWRKPRATSPGFVARQRSDPETLATATPLALRDFLRHGAAEPEHHIAAVGFIKYTGTDCITATKGPAATAAALHRLVANVQTVVDDEGVSFLASDIDEDGGKIIIVAGVPSVQEDDSGRMLRASRRILDLTADDDLQVKIGVNQGHVFVGDIGTDFRSTYTIMGDTVNLAARLMSAAPPGQVYSSAPALDASFTLFETTELEPFHVKGKDHPIQAFAVGQARGIRPRRQGGELPFIGRHDELDQLRSTIELLHHGAGGALTIVGERGTGKSRLVDELHNELDHVLHIPIRAEPYGTATPYRALRDPIRSLLSIKRGEPATMARALRRRVTRISPATLPYLPLIGDATSIPVASTPEVDRIEPKFRQARTADALTELLTAAFDGPVVFEVEDGHFMDEASANVMQRIAAESAYHPWLVLTTRTPGTDGFHPSGVDLTLGPLDDDASRQLVEAATEATPLRSDDIDAIVTRSAGLPIYLEELLRALRTSGSIDALPDSLEALVSAQIDALHPLTRRVLRYASVLGQSFRVETFNELVAEDRLLLDAATRRDLAAFIVADGRGRVRFRQAMTRDVSYGGLSFRRRKELHQRAAATFERTATDTSAIADVLALHYSLAGNHAQTWRYARIAGDEAAASYANVDAAVHYRRALDAVHRLTNAGDHTGAEANVWTALGDVCERAGRFDEAVEAFHRAGRLVRDDDARQVELFLRRATVRRRSGAYRTALSELTRAMRMVADGRTAIELRDRGRISTERASIRQWQQRPAEALRLAEAAEQDARAVNDLPTLGKTLDLIHWANLMTGNRGHEAPYDETVAIYESLGDLGRVADVYNNRGAASYFAGDWNGAIAAYERCSELNQQGGNDVDAAIAQANVAEVLINQRRFDEAEPLISNALRVLRASGHGPAIAFVESEQGRLALRRGELAEASTVLENVRNRAARAGEAANVLNSTLLLAEVRLAQRDPVAAGYLIETAEKDGGELAAHFSPTIGRLRAQAAAEFEWAEKAIAHVDDALAVARAQGLFYDLVLLLDTKATITQRFNLGLNLDELAESDRLIGELNIRREPVAATVS